MYEPLPRLPDDADYIRSSVREALETTGFLQGVGERLGVDLENVVSNYDGAVSSNSPLCLVAHGMTVYASCMEPGEGGWWCRPGLGRISFDVGNFGQGHYWTEQMNVLMYPDFDSAVRALVVLGAVANSSEYARAVYSGHALTFIRFLRASCPGWIARYDDDFGTWRRPDGCFDRSLGPRLSLSQILSNAAYIVRWAFLRRMYRFRYDLMDTLPSSLRRIAMRRFSHSPFRLDYRSPRR